MQKKRQSAFISEGILQKFRKIGGLVILDL